MGLINHFVKEHQELFANVPVDHVHPHDHFMAKTVLRLFPASVTPNQVTMFRIIATPPVFLLVLYQLYAWAMVAFVLVAFTDAIDGSMARTRNQITKFGIMFDPLADKLLIGSMVLVLVFQNFNFWLGIAILGIEIVFIMIALFANIKFKTVRMANIWGKMKMFLQVLAMCITLLAIVFQFPTLFTIAAGLFGLAIGFAIVSLFTHGL